MGVEKLLPPSLELATEMRPPAIQASHSVPSVANAGVTLVAHFSAVSSHAASEPEPCWWRICALRAALPKRRAAIATDIVRNMLAVRLCMGII